jgi:hypothetical protein
MEQKDVRKQLTRLQIPALLIGLVALGVWMSGFSGEGTGEQFYQSYLFAFLCWIAIPLGSLAILMLQYLIPSKWGYLIRRMLEAAVLTLPLMALLFIPIATSGLDKLYEWANPAAVAADPILQHKWAYLSPRAFGFRAVFYFVIWLALGLLLIKFSSDQERTGKPRISHWRRRVSGPGIVLYFLTMTFAAFDWGMSLEPHWYSAIYGVIFIVGQALATFAFMIVMMALLSKSKPFSNVASSKLYHDHGNLLLAFAILWTYMSLSQFLIIWSGNLPAENVWYIHRQMAGWNGIAIAVLLFQFVLPFFLLLNRFMKRKIEYLWKIALLIFLMRFVDLFWIVVPAFNQTVLDVPWMTYVAPVAIGGIWIAIFAEIVKRRDLFPRQDPEIEIEIEPKTQEALGHG